MQRWIDTPKVDAITDKPHGVAIRCNGATQDVLEVDMDKYNDPSQAH